jgi:hypothetical protein
VRGEFFERRLRSRLSGQDALDRVQREGAEADGAFQGSQDVGALIVGDEGQELLGLPLALDLFGEQAVEELHGDGAELLEALAQQQFPLARIVGGVMVLERLPYALHATGQDGMAGEFIDAGRVNDDFALGDTYGQDLANERPRHRVEVGAISDVGLDVDMAIEHQGGVEVGGRQG